MTFIQIAPLTGYSVGLSGAFSGQIGALTVSRTGQYLIAWNCICTPDSNGNHWVNFNLIVAGTQVITNSPTAIGIGVNSVSGNFWQGHIAAGQTVQLTTSQNGGSNNGGGTLVAYFIPTPAERA